MLRFGPRHLVLCPRNFVVARFDRRLVLLQLGLEFRHLKNRHHLAFVHMRAVIDVDVFDVSGLFGVDIDLLVGHQFGTHSEVFGQRPRLNLCGPYGYDRRCCAAPRRASLLEQPVATSAARKTTPSAAAANQCAAKRILPMIRSREADRGITSKPP